MIVRRHPNGGYLFSVIGEGPFAVQAYGFIGFAQYHADPENPPKERLSHTPLGLGQASRVVKVLREMNYLVDDKVLVVDERLSQWGKVLKALLVIGVLAAAFVTDRAEVLSWGSSAWLVLLGLASVALCVEPTSVTAQSWRRRLLWLDSSVPGSSASSGCSCGSWPWTGPNAYLADGA